jgi:hypothetical protein
VNPQNHPAVQHSQKRIPSIGAQIQTVYPDGQVLDANRHTALQIPIEHPAVFRDRVGGKAVGAKDDVADRSLVSGELPDNLASFHVP